ncbi:hypothetical protein CC80DRAFT_510591 [Byssothecium circinans]|uniref:Uncharacterized protein n=1 Tax=Byssothecium circinans TaxID=147558 RepID=A0A6A5T9V6_9PLEO|nr:hypothetical protein CC80DRAFT_510591 [Byssothecium circinans]
MESAQHRPSDLPPSPPPSPPTTRQRPARPRRKKHYHDPFLDLGQINSSSLQTTPPNSPPRSPPTQPPDEAEDSLLVRIIVTPILFTSFLLSLFLINRSDRLHRASTSTSTSSSPSTTSSKSLLSLLSPSSWLGPEPYQDPAHSTWKRRDSHSHVSPNDAISPGKEREGGSSEAKKREPWYLHKKIRKIAKMEISEALEMRGWVILGMGVVGALVAWGFWAVGWWLVGRVWV